MRLSYSSSLCIRARCKRCGSEPSFFYYVADKFLTKYIKPKSEALAPVSSFYLKADPKHFKGIAFFGCNLQGVAKVGARFYQYHKNRYVTGKMPVLITLTCKCGKSTWLVPNEKKRSKADRYFDKNLKYSL